MFLTLRNTLNKNVLPSAKCLFENLGQSSSLKKSYPKRLCNTLTKTHSRKNIYLIDEEATTNRSRPVNSYTERTVTCGELTKEDVGRNVTLCGWLEFRRLNRFLILRDGYGQTQIILDLQDDKLENVLNSLPLESVLRIKGTVLKRPENMINGNLKTGEVEVHANQVTVLNEARLLPFNIREFQKAKEALRMQYRYLDFRFPFMQRNLRFRSEFLMDMRHFLCRKAKFVDVETPTLFRATPGGAQEFVVPTRTEGLFYSLVQSPQQFKQMLMCGSIDRYFQIARCYRDEGSRPDRQPEFTQLDLEMSFTDVEGVIALVEDLLNYSWPDFLPSLPTRFRRMKYADAMEQYGSDKPDVRFDFRLKNCSDIVSGNFQATNENFQSTCENSRPTHENFHAACLVFDEPFNLFTNKIREKFSLLSKQYKTKFVQMKISTRGESMEKLGKLLGSEAAERLWSEVGLKENSTFFLAYGEKKPTVSLLGKIRLDFVDYLEEKGHKVKGEGMHMLWITDFPLFEEGEVPGKLYSAHHPFTAPNPEDEHLLTEDPLKVRALAYDLVLNGNEIAGGSIRIHDPTQQKLILELLDIEESSMQHMLDMLASGCPPHGGIALGLDRLLSLMLGTSSIRDVIAFPKTYEGRDLVSGAPSEISDVEKKLYHLNC